MKIILLLLILSTNRGIWMQAIPHQQQNETTVTTTTAVPMSEEDMEENNPEESVKVGNAAPSTNCDQSNQKQEVVVIFVNRSDIHKEQQENMEDTVSRNSIRENNTSSGSVLGSTYQGDETNNRNTETKKNSALAHTGSFAHDLDCTDTNNYETLASFRKKLLPRPLKVPRILNRIPSEPIACETLSDDEAALNQALIDMRRRVPRPKIPKRPQNLLFKRVSTPITTTRYENLLPTPYRIDNSNKNNNIHFGYGRSFVDNNNPNPYEHKRYRYPLVGNRAPYPRSRQPIYNCDYDGVEPAPADLTTLWNDWNNCDSAESSESSKESSESLDYLISSPNFFT